jgi:membrane peptidoglycan carboxypeptidase
MSTQQQSHESSQTKGDAQDGPPDRRSRWRRIFSWKTLGLSFCGLFVLLAGGVGIAFAVIDVPAPNDFSTSEASIVYFDDGKTEIGRFSAENREIVDADHIPKTLKDAVVAAEDRSFYGNAGFSPRGMIRAGWDSLRGSPSAGGGSTITQQYVKNYYLTQDRSLTRKLRELVISVKIDRDVDKDHILADYLNTIWFGRGAYGVQTAARSYFGVDVTDLDLAQSAALAAILRSPVRYDPTLGAENGKRFEQRFHYVLNGMVEIGAINRATVDLTRPPTILPEQRVNRYGGPNGYLLLMVRDELRTLGYDDVAIETGGLRITTSFNAQSQQAAVRAVETQRPTDNADRVHVGLAALRPNDGGIVAVYGGRDAVQQSFNDAIEATPQAGSSVKPFTLAAGLEKGYSLHSGFYGNSPFSPPELGPPVRNQGDRDYGRHVSLERAIENSVNTAFVDLTMTIGSQTVVDALIRAGFPADAPNLVANPRVTLGIMGVSALDMANSYATLAAEGTRADPYTVSTVTDRHGDVRYRRHAATRRVFEPDVVADVTHALTETVRTGTATVARDLDRPVAAKTGTHEDLTAWFSGYTPQLAAAVTYFRGDGVHAGTESLDGVGGMGHFSGGGYPGRTWTAFMAAALQGQPRQEFPAAANLAEHQGDSSDSDASSHDSHSDHGAETGADSGAEPSSQPSKDPTNEPTDHPIDEPTGHTESPLPHQPPTDKPSAPPIAEPTAEPTARPTEPPPDQPTQQPTEEPPQEPTAPPTSRPTEKPSPMPTATGR